MLAAVLVGLCGLEQFEQCWIVVCRHVYKNTSDPDRLCDMSGCRLGAEGAALALWTNTKASLLDRNLKNHGYLYRIASVEWWSYTNS